MKMKYLLIKCILITFVLMFTSCNKNELNGEDLKVNASDKEIKYYYEMPKNKVKELVHNVSKLEIGDTYDKVVKVLGPPTYDKKIYGKQFASPLKYRALDYYIKKYEKDLVNELYDVYIRIELNENDKLFKIVRYSTTPNSGDNLLNTQE